MKVQCACGGAFVGWSKRAWLHWMANHTCPAAESGDEPEGGDEPGETYIHGDAQVERSYQWNGQYDGEYRLLPEIQAQTRQPIGFHVT